MKVLVTGGAGFIGSHVCEYYVKNGDKAVAFDSLTKYELSRVGYSAELARNYNWNFLKNLKVNLVKGDIRNVNELLEAARDCDFIIHTAAQPAMTISIENPELDINVNVLGTFNVLETARKLDIPVVTCSTIHVYGNKINETLKEEKTRFVRDPPEINESHPLLEGTITPLHASKRCQEVYVQAFIDTYKLKAATYRLTGMYGPRQFGGEDHGWVANFSIKTLTKRPIKIFGTGKQVRDILYASDAARAFDAFYKKQKPGIYNVGGGIKFSISLTECLNTIEKISGIKPIIENESRRLGDLWYFVCDNSKIKKELGWEAKIAPEEGITKLIAWIKENINIFK